MIVVPPFIAASPTALEAAVDAVHPSAVHPSIVPKLVGDFTLPAVSLFLKIVYRSLAA